VPEGAFVVATAANMRPVKGADVLMQAALACADLADVYFVLMGRVHDRRVTRLAADPRATRVHLAGFIPDAGRLVSAADVFVMPSRAEALSVALLEAMTQGVCPVVSDAGGMKEAVRNGQDGLVFPSGDAAALADAIRALHADATLRRRLGASAQQRVAREFSGAAVAERLAEMYLWVVGREPRQALRRIA
jgi:glycosyltransferase involved in cell wall biosynthesis